MSDQVLVADKVQAGKFIVKDSETKYWTICHINRFFETAQENGQVLEIVVNFIQKTSS